VTKIRLLQNLWKIQQVYSISTKRLQFFYCCAGWWYIVALSKVLTIHQIYDIWIHPLYHSPFTPSPIPRIVLTGFIFPITYMCTQYLCNFHPHTTFPHFLPPLVPTLTTRKDLFHLPVLWFWKWKKKDMFICIR
jgi:hypothetical protein